MKASEIIRLLQEEVQKRGDLEVSFHGVYGAASNEFEIMTEKQIPKDEFKAHISVWTGIMTG